MLKGEKNSLVSLLQGRRREKKLLEKGSDFRGKLAVGRKRAPPFSYEMVPFRHCLPRSERRKDFEVKLEEKSQILTAQPKAMAEKSYAEGVRPTKKKKESRKEERSAQFERRREPGGAERGMEKGPRGVTLTNQGAQQPQQILGTMLFRIIALKLMSIYTTSNSIVPHPSKVQDQ